MEAQHHLVDEWSKEIDRVDESLGYLRNEYKRYKEIQNKQMCNTQKQTVR